MVVCLFLKAASLETQQ